MSLTDPEWVKGTLIGRLLGGLLIVLIDLQVDLVWSCGGRQKYQNMKDN